MGVSLPIATASIRPKHANARTAREHAAISLRYRPGARDLFPALRDRLLASRPVIGQRAIVPADARPDKKGVIKTVTIPIYGAPTFRNIIRDGVHQ